MEASTDPWIDALRRSHDALSALVQPLGEDALRQPSYASEWSIAQVLSHLGSGAQIFSLFLDAGLAGAEPPGQDAFPPIWQAWNERTPLEQATDALTADEAFVARLESLDENERAIRLDLFGMDLDVAALAGLRLGEHAVHSWDVAVALDPAATLAADAVDLLVDRIGQLAARSGKPGGTQLSARVTTSGPERSFDLRVGEGVTLEPADQADPAQPEDGAALRLPAEALVRLVYGRLDAAHTPPVEATKVDLDELRQVFPGF